MADEQDNDMPTVTLPPKQSPFKTVTLPAPAGASVPAAAAPAAPAAQNPTTVITKRPTLRRPGEAPKPVTLKPPMLGQPVVQPLSQTANIAKGIEISHADAAKKVTSRISVSSATAPIPPVTPAVPAATPIAAAAPAAAPSPTAEKKVTSRISLEAALSAPDAISEAQPRTIKLKRPGAPAAPAQSDAPAPLPPGMTPIDGDAAAATQDDSGITHRKTIKVKRPGAGGGPKITLNRPDGIASPDDNLQALSNFAASPKPTGEPDKVNPLFVIAAVLAAVFASLLIWTLASQTYGERGAAGDFAKPAGPSVPPPPWCKTFD